MQRMKFKRQHFCCTPKLLRNIARLCIGTITSFTVAGRQHGLMRGLLSLAVNKLARPMPDRPQGDMSTRSVPANPGGAVKGSLAL